MFADHWELAYTVRYKEDSSIDHFVCCLRPAVTSPSSADLRFFSTSPFFISSGKIKAMMKQLRETGEVKSREGVTYSFWAELTTKLTLLQDSVFLNGISFKINLKITRREAPRVFFKFFLNGNFGAKRRNVFKFFLNGKSGPKGPIFADFGQN